jgi:hypothetical protein
MLILLMYYSAYLILFGFLYYFKIIPINPYICLTIAWFLSFVVLIYLIINNVNTSQLLLFIILNLPKTILLLIIDKKNLLTGFIFYSILGFVYLMIFNDIYDIYYTKTIAKLLKNEYEITL